MPAHTPACSPSASLLDQLRSDEAWQRFLAYKIQGGSLRKDQLKDLQEFIANREYLPEVDALDASVAKGEPWGAPPRKKLVSKANSQKKRVLYVFSRGQNYVLKLLTFLVTRRYDHLFSPGLYSFRANTDARHAIGRLTRTPGISQMFSYKVDVSDYFGSVDVSVLVPQLHGCLADDPRLCAFFELLLTDQRVEIDGRATCENKGIIAGSAISTFFANVYLSDLDWLFADEGEGAPAPYVRYSDDIIVFAPTQQEIAAHEATIKQALARRGLGVNPAKEARTAPGQAWVFLGVQFRNGTVDAAPMSAVKLKAKMRRKSRSLLRWAARKGLDRQMAAKAFLRAMNRKLYGFDTAAVSGVGTGNQLTWSRWFFPLINTDETLRDIDQYMQQCIRYVSTGRRNKAQFACTYEDMKQLGYRSLVHEFWEGQGDPRT